MTIPDDEFEKWLEDFLDKTSLELEYECLECCCSHNREKGFELGARAANSRQDKRIAQQEELIAQLVANLELIATRARTALASAQSHTNPTPDGAGQEES